MLIIFFYQNLYLSIFYILNVYILLVKINDYPKDKIFKIIKAASTFEYRLSKGRRDIIHIETFLETVINTLK